MQWRKRGRESKREREKDRGGDKREEGGEMKRKRRELVCNDKVNTRG